MTTKKPDEPSIEDVMGGGEEVRLHTILSNDEVRAAQASARKKVEAERRLAAIAQLEAEETDRLRIEDGLTTGIDLMDEIVDITVTLAPYAEKISINGPLGKHYWHGKTYAVPRHVANTLQEIMQRMNRHEDQTEGRSIEQMYARKRDTAINARSGAIQRAPAVMQ